MASREEKAKRLNEILDECATITATIETEVEGKQAGNTPENQEKLKALLSEGDTLRKSIEADNAILGLKSFMDDPATMPKLIGGDGAVAEAFKGQRSLGDQIIEQERYKELTATGKVFAGMRFSFEAKGFLPEAVKGTFDSSSTGLDTSRIYLNRPVELVQQQRLQVRDLLNVGETSQGIVYFIKESSFTNAADTVAEGGEKPDATLATTSSSATVKKIAVTLKVTDEMWNDFPMLRDYVNTRLRFMVQQKEEDQLLNGSGSGNNITGLLNTSGIQTQAKGGDTNLDAIHKAITKIRTPTTGGYEPNGIIMSPTDYQLIRLAKDSSSQYYGGGPFEAGSYGNGGFKEMARPWGLPVVVTTAISAGTALVGAFDTGAQIWQREGISVEATNTNEDDFNFNRISLRIEERLALAVYAPGAFCTVTGIA